MAQHVESAGCNLRTRQKQAESQRKVAPIWHRSASTCILVLSLAGVAQAEPCGPPLPAVQLVTPVRGYDARDAHHDANLVCALTAADLTTTELILARGGREFTPLLGNRAVRVGIGALGCWALHDIAGKDPEKARKWAKVGLIVRGLAAAWNVRGLIVR